MGTMLRLPPIGRYGSLVAYIAMAYERRDVVNTSSVELVENVPFSFCEQAGGPPCVLEPHEAPSVAVESDIAARTATHYALREERGFAHKKPARSVPVTNLQLIARPVAGERCPEQRADVVED